MIVMLASMLNYRLVLYVMLHPSCTQWSWCGAADDKTHSSGSGCIAIRHSLPLWTCRGDESLECQKLSNLTYCVECYTYALHVFQNTFWETVWLEKHILSSFPCQPRPIAKHHFFLKGSGLLGCKVLVISLENPLPIFTGYSPQDDHSILLN